MLRRTGSAVVALPLLLALALTGCIGVDPDEGDPGTGSSGGESAEGVDSALDGDSNTACVTASAWNLDVDDMAAQLAEQLNSTGMTVVSATGAGTQTIEFTESGAASTLTDIVYTITVAMDEGVTMVMEQAHAGAPSGEWAWDGSADGDVMLFDNWTADYTVSTTTSVDGVTAPTTVSNLGGFESGMTMTVDCGDGTLTTQTSGSPYTNRWTAAD